MVDGIVGGVVGGVVSGVVGEVVGVVGDAVEERVVEGKVGVIRELFMSVTLAVTILSSSSSGTSQVYTPTGVVASLARLRKICCSPAVLVKLFLGLAIERGTLVPLGKYRSPILVPLFNSLQH